MWTIYQFEKHDIALYYCLPSDSTNGASYVHRLTDARDSSSKGARSLIQIVERTISALQTAANNSKLVEQTTVLHSNPLHHFSSSSYNEQPLPPPRSI